MHSYITMCRIFKYSKLQVHKPKAGAAYLCLLPPVTLRPLSAVSSAWPGLAQPGGEWMLCLGAATCPAPRNVLTSNIRKSGPQPEDHYLVSASPPASKTWELPPAMSWSSSVRETITAFVHSQSRVWSSGTGTLKQQIQKNVCTSIRAER